MFPPCSMPSFSLIYSLSWRKCPCRPPAPWGWPAAQTSAPSATATVGAGPTPACRQARDAARRGPRPQRDAAAGAALAAGPRRACLAASTPLRPGAGGAERSPPPRPAGAGPGAGGHRRRAHRSPRGGAPVVGHPEAEPPWARRSLAHLGAGASGGLSWKAVDGLVGGSWRWGGAETSNVSPERLTVRMSCGPI
jgi:hypothetical protein